ncbi:unnamed protein product [Calicophoron daubneyi]|uniref:Uncharacterized protein n=1 Tax=Calicophoron daubneyi TaxID=300641 RepID=A0AAV2T1S1_CALDB
MEKKITKIEEEMNRKIISCLLELLCSSSEYVSAEDLKELRAAKNKFASNKIETEALLTTVANARKNAVERMAKLVTAEMELKKTISETQKLVESWPASFKAALELRCTEDDSWLSVKEYGKDHCDTASEVEEETNQESKDRKNDSDSPDVEKNNEEKNPCDDENCTVLKPTDKLSEFAKDLPNRLKRPEYKPIRNVTE